MKWLSLMCVSFLWLENVCAGKLNYSFNYNTETVQCQEYIRKESSGYGPFFQVNKENSKLMNSDPNYIFEMHIAISAVSDGHILLSSVPNPTSEMSLYEIVVGGGRNNFTHIRRKINADIKASATTIGILSPTEFRAFYVKISKDGLITFGRRSEEPLFSYLDESPIKINYFSFQGWENVEVQYLYDCTIPSNRNVSNVTAFQRLGNYGYEFDEESQMWFKLHRLKATWHEARKMCNLEDAILASPLNTAMKYALETYPGAYNISKIFVGIHATFHGGLWRTIEGVSLETLTHLDINQIDGGENPCSVLNDGSLISVQCSEMHPYMCYKQENGDVQLTSCGTTDKEYILDERTGNCYKFYAYYPKTWWDAVKTCSAEEAHLAIINSDTEAQVITDIFKKYPDSVINGFYTNVVSLGFLDWEQNKEWYTIHGEHLEDSGYSNWSAGEPNNMDKTEFCGSMYRNGFLNDVPCSVKIAFICEKEVTNLNNSNRRSEANISNTKILITTKEKTLENTSRTTKNITIPTMFNNIIPAEYLST